MPRILTPWDDVDAWLDMQEADECDDGPCGDDPDCPCKR